MISYTEPKGLQGALVQMALACDRLGDIDNEVQADKAQVLRQDEWWASHMGQITHDMIEAGVIGRRQDVSAKSNGVVIGFMGVIGLALVHSRALDR
jgi:hypothetical protein